MKTIDDVRAFRDANPLFADESDFEPGTREYFEQHRQVSIEDCFAGRMDPSIFEGLRPDSRILDLGCGVGFWLVEFRERGFHSLTGADLSPKSLEIARQRCLLYDASPVLRVGNAESLLFDDESFDHVNCQGVIHHTPDTEKSVSEIARVLAPGGTASLSVYYRNIIVRLWPVVHPPGRFLTGMGKGLRGRGRSNIFDIHDRDEIVCYYDGKENPIGKSYSRKSFAALLELHFEIEKVYYYFFPMRSLADNAPGLVRRVADRLIPFMIYVNVRKKLK